MLSLTRKAAGPTPAGPSGRLPGRQLTSRISSSAR